MGGNAFGPNSAARLPQKVYDDFQAYVLPRLRSTGYFVDVKPLRHLGEKTHHGDLDVICAYEGVRPSSEEEWVGPITTPVLPNPTSIRYNAVGGEHETTTGTLDSEQLVTDPAEDHKNTTSLQAHLTQDQASTTAVTHTQGYIRVMGGKSTNLEHLRSIREVCAGIMAAIGATAWRRRTDIVSFKIPAHLLSVQGDHFYQLDLALTSPEDLAFQAFSTSFGCTTLLVGRMLVQLSRSFCLHMGDLSVRHPAFVGVPPVELVLTRDPKAFCEWFGLDWDVWCAGFETEKDFWKWLTTVDEGTDSADSDLDKDKGQSTIDHIHDQSRSPAARALRRMSARQREKIWGNPGSKMAIRAEPVGRFYDWLQNDSDWARYRQRALAQAQAEVIGADQNEPDKVVTKGEGRSLSEPEVISTEATRDEPTIPTPPVNQPTAAISLISPRLVAAPPPIPSTSSTGTTPSTPNIFIDPHSPAPLDWRVEEALEHWGKTDEYMMKLEAAKEKATFIATRQKQKELRRIAAATSLAGSSSGSGIGSPTILPKTPDTPGSDIPAQIVTAQEVGDVGPQADSSQVYINKIEIKSVKSDDVSKDQEA